MTLPDCFWSKTATDTGCVVWQGAQNSKGYGCFGVRRWDAAGRLRSTRTLGGQRRFARADVERAMTQVAS